MRRLVEELVGAVLSAIVNFDNFRNGIRPQRYDDPFTAEKRRLTRAWTLSFMCSIGVVVAAFVLSNLLASVGAATSPGNAFEPLQQGVFWLAAAAFIASTLSMLRCGYRLWRLERGA